MINNGVSCRTKSNFWLLIIFEFWSDEFQIIENFLRNDATEAEKNDRSVVKSGNEKSSKPGDSKTGGIMGLLASHLDAFHNANFSDSEEDENDDEDDWSE